MTQEQLEAEIVKIVEINQCLRPGDIMTYLPSEYFGCGLKIVMTISKLVQEKRICEIVYVVQDVIPRVKSFLLPLGSKGRMINMETL